MHFGFGILVDSTPPGQKRMYPQLFSEFSQEPDRTQTHATQKITNQNAAQHTSSSTAHTHTPAHTHTGTHHRNSTPGQTAVLANQQLQLLGQTPSVACRVWFGKAFGFGKAFWFGKALLLGLEKPKAMNCKKPPSGSGTTSDKRRGQRKHKQWGYLASSDPSGPCAEGSC